VKKTKYPGKKQQRAGNSPQSLPHTVISNIPW